MEGGFDTHDEAELENCKIYGGAEQFRPTPPERVHLFSLDLSQSCSMLTTRRWACLQRYATANPCQLWPVRRYQSTVPSPASTISPALLGRAQALAAEHAELSKQLNDEYDGRIAKKAGSLSAVVMALNDWKSASSVRPHSSRQMYGH